jgi:hypothetical protein
MSSHADRDAAIIVAYDAVSATAVIQVTLWARGMIFLREE